MNEILIDFALEKLYNEEDKFYNLLYKVFQIIPIEISNIKSDFCQSFIKKILKFALIS